MKTEFTFLLLIKVSSNSEGIKFQQVKSQRKWFNEKLHNLSDRNI